MVLAVVLAGLMSVPSTGTAPRPAAAGLELRISGVMPASPPPTASAGASWRDVTWGIANAPPLASYDSVVYDSTDREAVYFDGTGSNATWTFQNGSWTELHLTVAPPPVWYPAISDDPADGGVLLFGGLTGPLYDSPETNGTWLFHHGTWSEVRAVHAPGLRMLTSMAYDPAIAEVILFGGAQYDRARTVLLNDTWGFANGTWTDRTRGTSPPGREQYGFSSDPGDAGVLLMGGDDTINPLGDTWVYNRTGWYQVTPSTGPSARSFPALAFDSEIDAILLFGGLTPYGSVGDTWKFSHGQWTALTGSGPRADEGAAMFDDPVENCTYLLWGGSAGENPALYNRTWAFGSALSATASVSSGLLMVNGSFAFDASAALGIPPYSFDWSFGDGSRSTNASGDHVYLRAGNYPVNASVADRGGPVTWHWEVRVTPIPCEGATCSGTGNSAPGGGGNAGAAIPWTWAATGAVVAGAILGGTALWWRASRARRSERSRAPTEPQENDPEESPPDEGPPE